MRKCYQFTMIFHAYIYQRYRERNYLHLHLTIAEIFVKLRFYENKKRWTDLQRSFDVPSLECAILSFQARWHNSLLHRSNHIHIYSDIYILFIPVRDKLNMYTHHVLFALRSLSLPRAILPVISFFSSTICCDFLFSFSTFQLGFSPTVRNFVSRTRHCQLLLWRHSSTHHIQLYLTKLIRNFLC